MRVIKRAEADEQLDTILRRVTYVGPEPRPSEEALLDMAAEDVRAVRAKHAKRGSR